MKHIVKRQLKDSEIIELLKVEEPNNENKPLMYYACECTNGKHLEQKAKK